MNLARAFVICASALALAACTGAQTSKPTVVKQVPDYALVGNYCSQKNIGGSSAFLRTLEDRISSQASAQAGKDYKENLAVVIEKDTGIFAHGIHLGDGYILTAAHVTYTPISTGTHFKRLWVGYTDPASRGSAEKSIDFVLAKGTVPLGLITASSSTISTAEDIALVYAPTRAKVSLPEFRTSALSVGEEVFAQVFLPTGAGVSSMPGKITSLAGDSTIYQNQFQTSIFPVSGMSGAPVFDGQGRLIGIISGFTVEPVKPDKPENYTGSNVSRINSVKALLEVERQKMADCPR